VDTAYDHQSFSTQQYGGISHYVVVRAAETAKLDDSRVTIPAPHP